MINTRKARYLVLSIVFSAGILFSSAIFYLAYTRAQANIKTSFDEAAEYRFKYIEDVVDSNMAALHSFGDLFSASQQVDRHEFDVFAQGIFLRQPYIYEFRWLPRVAQAQRQAFEESARKEGLTDFTVTEPDQRGNIVTSPQYPEYFPVYYISHALITQYAHNPVFGLDAASIPERWEAMQRARDSGKAAVVVESKHYGEVNVQHSSRIYLPIYSNNLPHNSIQERRDNLVGFVVLLYRMDDMINAALKNIPREDIDIFIYQKPQGEGKLIYTHFSGPSGAPKDAVNTLGLLWSRQLTMADQKWLLSCTANPQFLASRRIVLPWVLLLAGLIITLLLTFYLKGIVDRAKTIELLVDKRTEELREANKELAQLEQLKSKFVSTVSHELRTPLTAIKECLNVVSDGSAGPLNTDQHNFLSIVKRNVDRLGRLINNVLDFQKLESGKMIFGIQENDLNSVVAEVKSIMEPLCKQKGLQLGLSLAQNAPTVEFDRDKIVQVLINLMNNAIKFTERGRIDLSVHYKGPPENFITVSVRDTGPGIRQEDLPRMFQHFEQLEPGHEGMTEGTGLGLAISKEIIERHSGKIWAESKFGEGTTINFLLPIKERRS